METSMIIDYVLLKSSIFKLLYGAQTTLQIAGYSCVLGLTLGSLCAFAQLSTYRIIRILAFIYITLIRGTPMLIQIAFLYYGILPLIGIPLTPLWAAIVAIGLNSGAYVSQTIKAGILAVGKGQLEAAQVLGFTRLQTALYIVFPQALKVVLPALGNEFITLIKDSSLASTIGVVELFKEGFIIISQTYDALTVYTGVALVYLALTTVLSLGVTYLERKLHAHAYAN